MMRAVDIAGNEDSNDAEVCVEAAHERDAANGACMVGGRGLTTAWSLPCLLLAAIAVRHRSPRRLSRSR